MMFGGLLLFALLIWMLTRGAHGEHRYYHQDNYGSRPDEPMETLRHRLAAGEVTTEEFDRIKAKILTENRRP